MKMLLNIVVLAVLVFAGPGHCIAVQATHLVSDVQYAQKLGANIGWEPVGTNDIEVWLEFSPHYQLARFTECDLAIGSDARNLVSVNSDGSNLVCAKLSPTKLTGDRVVFSFTVSRDFVEKSSLRLVVGDDTNTDYYIFAAKDFVKASPATTFIGVPRTVSTNTFEDVGGFKRKLKVDMLTTSSFGLPQENVSFYANWPWPQLAVKYSITAAYGQHDELMIVDYHEIK